MGRMLIPAAPILDAVTRWRKARGHAIEDMAMIYADRYGVTPRQAWRCYVELRGQTIDLWVADNWVTLVAGNPLLLEPEPVPA